MTERFNANSEGTTISSSGVGPAGSGSSLVALGLGQGPGQTANKQENNQFAQFEYPIKWDDVANALGRLGEKQKVDELLDDMSTRDRVLEDYLNTNVVNGIVAGSRVTIDRAAGVVTITATDQSPGAWTPFTPQLLGTSGVATISNNGSAWTRFGSIVHVRLNCRATLPSNGYILTVNNLPVRPVAAQTNTVYHIGVGESEGFDVFFTRDSTASDYAVFNYIATVTLGTVFDVGGTMTYEAT